MKRLFTLVMLLGLLGVVAGCNKDNTTTSGTADTNAPTPPATTTTTNK